MKLKPILSVGLLLLVTTVVFCGCTGRNSEPEMTETLVVSEETPSEMTTDFVNTVENSTFTLITLVSTDGETATGSGATADIASVNPVSFGFEKKSDKKNIEDVNFDFKGTLYMFDDVGMYVELNDEGCIEKAHLTVDAGMSSKYIIQFGGIGIGSLRKDIEKVKGEGIIKDDITDDAYIYYEAEDFTFAVKYTEAEGNEYVSDLVVFPTAVSSEPN